MIQAILVFNNHGKPRLVRFYQRFEWLSFTNPLGKASANFSPLATELDGSVPALQLLQGHICDERAVVQLDRLQPIPQVVDAIVCDKLTVGHTEYSKLRTMYRKLDYRPISCLNIFFQPEEIQQQIVRETFHLVLKRDDNICNFLEGGSLIGGSDYKLIYRHYATLYFVFCVDSSESELGILDLIQVFVETLDKCFENVCELDLIFHMDKVHYILQEVVMGGMVLETNMNEIVAQMEAQNRLEKSEGGLSAAPARAVSAVKNMNLPEIPRNINIGDLNIKVPNLSQFV
ncbi:AP-3 complex subunit sigma-2 [Fukomys damarensis]|uniref:AP-3 complex subunit sigma-2 n=1 Tax=Fukomys damarensis TaxID=885580 RepID=A0A091DWD9_FUKDA|nr:AP-3 complex subunit sigma-2 [Fukomys damarensis]